MKAKIIFGLIIFFSYFGISEALIDATCGGNARNYTTDETAYTGTGEIDFCSAGTLFQPIDSIPFPDYGGGASWDCLGIDGGVNIQCIATRDELSWWDWSGIMNTIIDFKNSFINIFSFSFSYTGFNFVINDLYNFFIFDLDGIRNTNSDYITIKQDNCEVITKNNIIYNQATSFGTIPNGLLDYLPNSYFHDVATPYNFTDPYSWTLYEKLWIDSYHGYPITRDNIIIQKKEFDYISNYNKNIFILNDTIFDNVNWFPFSLVLFGIDTTAYINDFFSFIVGFTLKVLKIPIDIINIIFNMFNVTTLQIGSGAYCYAGTTIILPNNMMGGTLLDSINEDINSDIKTIGTNTGNQSTIIYLFILAGLSYRNFKKIIKII